MINRRPFLSYRIFGAEEGWHIATNLATKDPIARGLAGANVSFRWPFNVTHNFLGSSPITFEAQYLFRWLAYPEPFADFANLPPAGTPPPCPPRVGIGVITSSTGQLTCGAVEVLSSKAQSLFRGDISFPLDPYIQVTASVTKGSLPPSFWLIGWTYSLGLTFGNNASSEHERLSRSSCCVPLRASVFARSISQDLFWNSRRAETITADDGGHVSYLERPRFTFSGRFEADVSTVNNNAVNFDAATFLPKVRHPPGVLVTDPQGNRIGMTNGWWNPTGTGNFDY